MTNITTAEKGVVPTDLLHSCVYVRWLAYAGSLLVPCTA